MASQAPLSRLTPRIWAESELARRVALAREPEAEVAPRPPLARLAGELDWVAERFRRPFRSNAIARCDDPKTVMVLPGFATHPIRMRYLARQLESAGHRTKRWGLGLNLGPNEETLDHLERRLLEVRRRYNQPVVLLGWSLGGIFARELAKRQPAAVGKVITMGSPFSGSPRANNVWRIYQFVTGHSVDAPPIEANLAEKPPVETVAMWSPRDGIIDPRSACGKAGERDRAIALRCTHMGFSYDPEVVEAVLRELNSN